MGRERGDGGRTAMKEVAPRASFDIGAWLRGLGLAQYETTFRENGIDLKLLPKLTVQDLKELGVGALGHRRKLFDAIAELPHSSLRLSRSSMPKCLAVIGFCDLSRSRVVSWSGVAPVEIVNVFLEACLSG